MAIEVVFEKKINNATVYRDVDETQRRQNYLLTFLAALFVMSLLFYGWQQYRWFQLGYDVQRLLAQKNEILTYQKRLVFQRETLAQDSRIDLKARTELGMVTAAPGQIVTLVRDVPGTVPPTADEVAAPLSAANLNVRPVARTIRNSDERCSEVERENSGSGGRSAEGCREAR